MNTTRRQVRDPSAETPAAVAPGDRLLYLLLVAVVVVPALAFVAGSRGGRFTFVLYREPKLAALQVLGWTFLIVLWWLKGPRLARHFRRSLLRQPTLACAGLWIAYATLTGLWVEVGENYRYELAQYIFLLLFLVSLRLWGSFEPRVRGLLVGSLVASLAPITLIGLIQLRVDLPFLLPIDPELGVRYPSLMGYKNPMALSLLAQIFLLAHLVLSPRLKSPWRWSAARLALTVLLGLEVVYLAVLQSRAAYLAVAVAIPFLLVALLWRARDWRRVGRTAAAFAAAVLLVLGFMMVTPASRQRLESIGRYLGDEVLTLKADRTTYLLNTLEMVKHRPFGVGLGDWQTHYPVYRRHNRYTAFSEEIQVRRAHSDYVQVLGETGWQGLALWVLLWISSLSFAVRRFRATGDRLFLFLGLQLLAVAVASAGDYFVELPYNKLQLFLLLAILLQPPAGSAPRPGAARRFLLPAILVTVLGIAGIAHGAGALYRGYHAAALKGVAAEITVGRAVGIAAERLAEPIALATFHGERFRAGFGHGKTFHKDYLVLAHLAWLSGERQQAIADATEALRLHPFYPNAFKLLAELTRSTDPQRAAHYREAHRYILHRANAGFRRPYPPLPGEPDG